MPSGSSLPPAPRTPISGKRCWTAVARRIGKSEEICGAHRALYLGRHRHATRLLLNCAPLVLRTAPGRMYLDLARGGFLGRSEAHPGTDEAADPLVPGRA